MPPRPQSIFKISEKCPAYSSSPVSVENSDQREVRLHGPEELDPQVPRRLSLDLCQKHLASVDLPLDFLGFYVAILAYETQIAVRSVSNGDVHCSHQKPMFANPTPPMLYAYESPH